MRGAELVPL